MPRKAFCKYYTTIYSIFQVFSSKLKDFTSKKSSLIAVIARQGTDTSPTWKKDELYKEGIDAAIAAEKAKQSYFLAKQNGKLWSKGEKEASREAKRVARREARLAKKNLVTS